MATRLLGTLSRWNADRGFGFIVPDGGGADIFVHASDMSRIGGAPQVGWRLDFQARPGKDGRLRAFDVQREGMRLVQPPKSDATPVPRPSRPAASRRPGPRFRSPVLVLAVLAVLGLVGFLLHDRSSPVSPDSEVSRLIASPVPAMPAAPASSPAIVPLPVPAKPASAPSPEPAVKAPTAIPSTDDAPSFVCDGRIHCSQMHSCAEATWFLEHCPGTKMDGNHDGVPCEQQWCN